MASRLLAVFISETSVLQHEKTFFTTPYYSAPHIKQNHTIKLRRNASMNVNSGFVLDTTLTPASEHDPMYLAYHTIMSCHTEEPIENVYGG